MGNKKLNNSKTKTWLNRLKYALFSAVLISISLYGVWSIALRFIEEPKLPVNLQILDMHVHTAGIGAGNSGCFISKQMKESYKYPFYLYALGVSESAIEEFGDKLVLDNIGKQIDKSVQVADAIVLAMDGAISADGTLDTKRTEVYVPNSFLIEQLAHFPKLHFGASVNPYRPDALQQLDYVKENGAVLIKWIPSIMHIDPSDPKLAAFYQKMISLDLPLLTHTGQERSFSTAIDEYADPLKLELPLGLGLTVIAAHIATTGESEGQDNFQRIIPMFNKYPNLYADISSLTQVNKLGFLKQALAQPELHGRLLYGTDWPLQFFPLISPWYHFPHLTIGQIARVSKIDNAWDRDIQLKRELGVPDDVFLRARELLNLPLQD